MESRPRSRPTRHFISITLLVPDLGGSERGQTVIFLPSFAPAKKFAESQPKKDTPRKEKGSREEKQKPQAERKEEKKAAAPAPEEELDECEQALAAEPKAKDPFAHLPKRYGCWRVGGMGPRKACAPLCVPLVLPGPRVAGCPYKIERCSFAADKVTS